MMGRTHSVHAEPTTFGLKLAGWAFELDRGRDAAGDGGRRDRDRQDLGTGRDVQPPRTRTSRPRSSPRSGCTPTRSARQIVQRDRHAALLAAIAILGGSLERFATEIRNLQHTEIGEVQEPFKAGQKGSLGDAPQAQPDPVRADRRAGPAAARLRAHGVRGPAAVARARHQPLQRRAGHPARTRRSCSTTCSCG